MNFEDSLMSQRDTVWQIVNAATKLGMHDVVKRGEILLKELDELILTEVELVRSVSEVTSDES